MYSEQRQGDNIAARKSSQLLIEQQKRTDKSATLRLAGLGATKLRTPRSSSRRFSSSAHLLVAFSARPLRLGVSHSLTAQLPIAARPSAAPFSFSSPSSSPTRAAPLRWPTSRLPRPPPRANCLPSRARIRATLPQRLPHARPTTATPSSWRPEGEQAPGATTTTHYQLTSSRIHQS
jgi:hypothetical protein